MTLRVGILLRLSTKKQAKRQGKDEADIPVQRQIVTEFAEGKGWKVVREYVEMLSAYKNSADERDALQDAIRDAQEGAIDVLVVWKLDRLSRQTDETPTVVKRFQKSNVQLWSVVDAPGGRQWTAHDAMETLMLSLEGFKSQSESESTSIRVSSYMKQYAAEGRWHGGKVPFGFALIARKDLNGEPLLRGGRLVRDLTPHADNAPVVHEIFRRYLSGEGYFRLAQWMNGNGILTYTGAPWTVQTVQDVVTNPLYCGRIVYARTKAVDLGSKRRRRAEVPITAKGNHEALVDEVTWDHAQALRKARTSIPARQRNVEYPLVGVLRCGVCGRTMGGHSRFHRKNGEEVQTPVYRCLTHKSSRLCPVTTYYASAVEDSFITALEGLVKPGGLRDIIEQRLSAQTERDGMNREERRRAKERIEEIRKALVKLDKAFFESDLVSDGEYRQKKMEYQEEDRALEVLLATSEIPTTSTGDIDALGEAAKELRANWQYLTASERKTFVLDLTNAWGLRVVVHPDIIVALVDEGEQATVE